MTCYHPIPISAFTIFHGGNLLPGNFTVCFVKYQKSPLLQASTVLPERWWTPSLPLQSQLKHTANAAAWGDAWCSSWQLKTGEVRPLSRSVEIKVRVCVWKPCGQTQKNRNIFAKARGRLDATSFINATVHSWSRERRRRRRRRKSC